jgi:hypothetical protein
LKSCSVEIFAVFAYVMNALLLGSDNKLGETPDMVQGKPRDAESVPVPSHSVSEILVGDALIRT